MLIEGPEVIFVARQSRNITTKQVAKRAGVSRSTVLFVPNNVATPRVSNETRQRVLQAVEEPGFVPDMAAQTVTRGDSNYIALVTSRPHRQLLVDEFFPHILTGLRIATEESGFRIIVGNVGDYTTAET